MLWTDDDFINTADLKSIDPEVVSMASSNEVVLEGDAGTIRRGIEDAGRYLEGKLVGSTSFESFSSISSNHLNAVLNTGAQATQLRRFVLEQVVVTDRNAAIWSDIKHWVAIKCLERIYLAAVNASSSDRYQEKFDRFKRRGMFTLWPELKRSGIPIVQSPLAAPEALFARDPGTFTASEVSGSGTLDSVTYDVCVTYTGPLYTSQAIKGNNESFRSKLHQVDFSTGNVLKVDVTNLSFPVASQAAADLARGVFLPVAATGWNVYAGEEGGTLYLQNDDPIAAATKTLTLAANPVTSGYSNDLGQYAQSFLTIQDVIQRG